MTRWMQTSVRIKATQVVSSVRYSIMDLKIRGGLSNEMTSSRTIEDVEKM